MRVLSNRLALGLVVVVLASTGCDAPKEQQDWGGRKGGLNLPPKEGSQQEKDEAAAAAQAARNASEAKAAEATRLEDREGGLNLAPKRGGKPPKQ